MNIAVEHTTKIESNFAEPYLDLMKKCLTRYIFPDKTRPLDRPSRTRHPLAWVVYPSIAGMLGRRGLRLYRDANFDPAVRAEGRDWPVDADTMIGLRRLDNLHSCIEQVLRDDIPGDFIETGVWRGGACIFMRAALNAYMDSSRQVWVADSFEGLPKPDGRYQQDDGDDWWSTKNDHLGVSLDQVKFNFSRYGLLDDRVRFLKGWFKDTLPTAPITRLAILRLDGDMYSSTMDSLLSLYPKLSAGGYVIIDDYGIDSCRKAVDDFRANEQIEAPLIPIDWTGIYWRKLD